MANDLLTVKNMVCHRCVLAVEDILRNEFIDFTKVEVGEIHLQASLQHQQKESLAKKLNAIGLELITDHAGSMIEKIKQLIIRRARNEVSEQEKKIKLSVDISIAVNHEYTYLSSLFSSIEGRTIENYFLEQRIEKAKELLVYGQMTLSEIAFELDYSSTAHLSNQFKKLTGLTPSYFKQVGKNRRKALDHI